MYVYMVSSHSPPELLLPKVKLYPLNPDCPPSCPQPPAATIILPVPVDVTPPGTLYGSQGHFVTGLSQCPPGPSVSWRVSGCPSFLKPVDTL